MLVIHYKVALRRMLIHLTRGQLYRRLILLLSAIVLWSLSTQVQARMPTSDSETIQPYFDKIVERVSEFTLDNGMKFIVLENHTAPVISFVTYADVGGVDEPEGKTGVAHFIEHLAFKGTKNIGTTNYRTEAKLLKRLDRLWEQIQAAEAADDRAKAEQLQAEFVRVQTEASQYVKQNEFAQIVKAAGGTGLNAATSADYTKYFYSFPSNKLELWMALESDRFLEPVFREFYKEKEVVQEERRLRYNSPMGNALERFLVAAFTEHPYKNPVIGYEEDIRNLTREDVRQFFKTYYAPNNLTIAIVGDVEPQRVEELAQTYFDRYEAKPEPPKVTEVEPEQTEPRQVTLKFPAQPIYLEGYRCPAITDADEVVYEIIVRLLSSSRTSGLYKSLVKDRQIAVEVGGSIPFPGDKYPNLLLFDATTAPNRSVDELEQAFREEIERFKTEPVTEPELERARKGLRTELVQALDSNKEMADLLAEFEAKTGSWQKLFERIEMIATITPADVQRVAQKTFTPENRTIVRLVPPPSEDELGNS